jgi:hypothetical protein
LSLKTERPSSSASESRNSSTPASLNRTSRKRLHASLRPAMPALNSSESPRRAASRL